MSQFVSDEELIALLVELRNGLLELQLVTHGHARVRVDAEVQKVDELISAFRGYLDAVPF